MKKRYQFVLFLSYKLRIKLFRRVEDRFLKQIYQNFKLVRPVALKSRHKIIKFEKNKYNSNFIELTSIVLDILSMRALTRTILNSIREFPNPEEVYKLTRFKLIFIILQHRRVIFQNFLSHLSYNYMDYEEYSTLKTLKISYYGNKKLGSKFRTLENYCIEKKDYSRSYSMNYGMEAKLRMTTLDKFIYWDSRIFVRFLKFHKLEEIASDYLSTNFPYLAMEINKFRRIQYINHELSMDTLDYIYKKNGLDYSEIIPDAEIWHQRFIYANNMILNIDATTYPTQEFVAGNWQFTCPNGAGSSEILLMPPSENTVDLKEAIYLLGRCDENWYHFLLDTAPRLLFFDNIPLNIPILIRDDLPLSCRELLSKLTQRKIVEVGLDEKVRISKLYVCPGRSTVFDSYPPEGINQVDFSPLVLNLFRDRVLNSFGVILDSSFPKLIALPRSGAIRNVLTWTYLEKVFDDFSFQILLVNDRLFRNQVKVFFNTKFVAAPGGAILANIIFMKPGSKVLVLKSWRNSNLHLWSDLCQSLNLEYIEILGLPTYWGSDSQRREHSNYYISPRKLRRILSKEI